MCASFCLSFSSASLSSFPWLLLELVPLGYIKKPAFSRIDSVVCLLDDLVSVLLGDPPPTDEERDLASLVGTFPISDYVELGLWRGK